LPEAELRYLQMARNVAPDDPETLRMLARTLTREGRFNDAIGPWFAVLATAPDREAEQAVEDLRRSQECIEEIQPLPEYFAKFARDSDSALRWARMLKEGGGIVSAEQHLIYAQTALGGSPAIWHEREELQLARGALRVEIARRRAKSDSHPRAQHLVEKLLAEQNRLEIDIFHLRSEREPGNFGLRLELARRLKQAGNFSGAIQRLEEARRDPKLAAAVLLELGECWQHLRQFAKAIDFYHQAVTAAEQCRDQWSPSAALYRIGVLAAAMNNPGQARTALEQLVAADPDYKDARERLDKLR
jgi:tetratricopeptide (TPR) repeat protein